MIDDEEQLRRWMHLMENTTSDDDDEEDLEAMDREKRIADRRRNLDRAPFGRYVRITNEGYYLEIPLKGIRACGVDLNSVTMYIAPDEDEGDGDLAVEYDTTGLDDQRIRQAMYNFYRKSCWTQELQVLLQRVGFGTDAARSVEGSESGMQDTDHSENLVRPLVSIPLLSPSQAPQLPHGENKSQPQTAPAATVDIIGVIKVELGTDSGWAQLQGCWYCC